MTPHYLHACARLLLVRPLLSSEGANWHRVERVGDAPRRGWRRLSAAVDATDALAGRTADAGALSRKAVVACIIAACSPTPHARQSDRACADPGTCCPLRLS